MERSLSRSNQRIRSSRAKLTSSTSCCADGKGKGQELIVVRSLSELERWKSEWDTLTLGNTEPVSAFLWNQAWYRAHLDVIDEMLVFIAFRNGAVSAILPTYSQENEIRLASDEFSLCHDLICRDEGNAKFAVESIFSWLLEEKPHFQVRLDNLLADGFICEIFSRDEEPVDGLVIFSGESESRPAAPVADGYADYVRGLPEEISVELRSALRAIDRDLPRAHIEIKRGYDIRVDLLSRTLQFIEANGRSGGTPFYFDPISLAFFGELAKCEEMGLQTARLIDQGDTFSADVGLIFAEGYFPLLYAFDSEFEDVKPYESLFLSRINDWICRHETETVFFPCREESLAERLSGGIAQATRSLTLMSSQGLDRHGSSVVLGEAEEDGATAPILAR